MAGSYSDVPGPRMPWDRDGTVLVFVVEGDVIEFSSDERVIMNNESNDSVALATTNTDAGYLAMIFPELRDIDGFCMIGQRFGGGEAAYYSADTTNGVDGTWTLLIADYDTIGNTNTVRPTYRTDWVAVSQSGVKGLKWDSNRSGTLTHNVSALHVYGSIHAGETPDRLQIWDPSLNQEVTGAQFDLGDVARGTEETFQFRVRNNSSTKTAQTITISCEALSTETPVTTESQYTFSLDDVTYSATLDIGDLAPGVISAIVYCKRTTPTNMALNVLACRIIAHANSMT